MECGFDDRVSQLLPDYKVIVVAANVESLQTDDNLWREISAFADSYRALHAMEDVNKRPGIAATRRAYKTLGKDPNRYRPSTEALCRRLVKGLDLYRSLALIDLVNLLSMASGYSIGAFDADKIVGTDIVLGVGAHGEPYEAIGRGQLNIEGLPVWRDSVGGFGTPTSDNERTKITSDTQRLLMTVNIFGDDMPADHFAEMCTRLLQQYAGASDITYNIYKP